jgi:peptidoglycan/LPS O-acetylase OafA/YrhL
LDGLRALAAWYVVVHHIWLASYHSFPVNDGPWILGWLIYGHFAVATFIVVSGYSLTMVPARNQLRLPRGSKGFAKARAWRILPPYWLALAYSMLVVDLVTAPRAGGIVGAKSLLVHGLLLQDVVGSTSPNGTFWSIAVECQIYLLFPLMLWCARRLGAAVTVGTTAALVVVAHELAAWVPAFSRIDHLTPQFLALFAFGALAAAWSRNETPPARLPAWVGGGSLILLVVAVAVAGPRFVTSQYFWVDLAFGAIVASVFVQLAIRPGCLAVRVLSGRLISSAGHRSYSVYLVHAPLLAVLYLYVATPARLSTTLTFAIMSAMGLPVTAAVSEAFFRLCERPFLLRRSWAAWRAWARDRIAGTRQAATVGSIAPALPDGPDPA